MAQKYQGLAIYWLRCLAVCMKYLDEKQPVEGSLHTAQRNTWMPWQGEGERRRGRPSVSLSSSVSLGILSLWGQSLSKRCHYIPQPWQRAAVFSESCHLLLSGWTGWVGACIVLDVTWDLKCKFHLVTYMFLSTNHIKNSTEQMLIRSFVHGICFKKSMSRTVLLSKASHTHSSGFWVVHKNLVFPWGCKNCPHHWWHVRLSGLNCVALHTLYLCHSECLDAVTTVSFLFSIIQ